MKVIPFSQPWGWLVAKGYKTIDNRPQWANYRGDFLIHATAHVSRKDYAWAVEHARERGAVVPPIEEMKLGGIIGMGTLKVILRPEWFDSIDAITKAALSDGSHITDSDTRWWMYEFRGKRQFGYVVRNARELPFIPHKGSQGMRDATPELAATAARFLRKSGPALGGEKGDG